MKDDMVGLLIGFTFLAIILMGIILLPILAFYALPFAGAFVLYIKWRDNPTRKENEARRHLEEMYKRTLAGTLANFSREDIDNRLNRHLPGYLLGTDTERQLVAIGHRILDRLDIATVVPHPPTIAYGIEGGRYLDKLAKVGTLSPEVVKATIDTVAEVLGYFGGFVPREGGEYSVPLSHFIKDKGEAVECVSHELSRKEAFKPILAQLDEALTEQKGVYPTAYKGKEDVVEVYLRNTPLEDLFHVEAGFGIPLETRFSHTHIIGQPGSGKTTLIESLIASDIRAGHNVILIDGQEDVIKRILAVAPLERVIHIDPNDVEYPLALNLFDVGQERFASYVPLEREKAVNRTVELFNFIFNSFASDLTSKQDILFSYVTMLMLQIPGANINTMIDLLDVKGLAKQQEHIQKLSPSAQSFFNAEFDGREYNDTKKEVRYRLRGLMRNATFERIFSHTRSKLSIYDAMNGDGNIILINTAKALLQEKGHGLFGRMFIAMILQATQERAGQEKDARKPTFLYIDECYDYLDENVETMLETARKYRVGCILAHHHFGSQISMSGRSSLNAMTAIKMAGKVAHEDVNTMAKHLETTNEAVVKNPEFTFLTYIRGIGTLPLRVPKEPFEGMECNRQWELEDHRDLMRELYAEPVVAPPDAPSVDDPTDADGGKDWLDSLPLP